jgi:hypothetical protein
MFSCLLIIKLYIIMFHVCLVPLTHFSYDVLNLCVTVLPFTGFFKNITHKKSEDLLYSVYMIHIFGSLNIKNILLLFRSL